MDLLRSWRLLLHAPHLVWSPRLTAGIYAVTRILDAKAVIIPNVCCPAAVYGIILAGAEPVFCETYLSGAIDPDACEILMRATNASLVLHVHPVGIYADRTAIHKLCQRYNAFLFEDGASWFPPKPDYEILESSCLGLSFGWHKMFDLGGGSLLALGDGLLADELRRFLRFLPAAPEKDMLQNYQTRYDELVTRGGPKEAVRVDLSILAKTFEPFWIGNTPYFASAPQPQFITNERRRRVEIYTALYDMLQHFPTVCFDTCTLAFPWRFTFLSNDPSVAEDLFQANGLFVSRLHPVLDQFFPQFRRSVRLEHSRQVAAHIYNIDLSPAITIETIELTRRRYWRNRSKRQLRRAIIGLGAWKSLYSAGQPTG